MRMLVAEKRRNVPNLVSHPKIQYLTGYFLLGTKICYIIRPEKKSSCLVLKYDEYLESIQVGKYETDTLGLGRLKG